MVEQSVAYLVPLVESSEAVIETLSDFNTNINKQRIEKLFNKLIPDYQGGQSNQKYENMLYQSVFNYDSNSESYEYTYKITPALRLSEYYLGEIFEKIDGGHECVVNKWGYHRFNNAFEPTSEHHLKSSFKDILSDDEKVRFVESLYNFYNSERSKYFHTNDDALDTLTVDSNQEAKDILKEAFELFDKYYVYFV